MKRIYMAHQLGQGEGRERNRQNAIKWHIALSEHYNVAVVSDWITLSGVWPESNRERCLEIDKVLIEGCDEIWLTGGLVSSGMLIEITHADRVGTDVLSLIHLGYEAPQKWCGDPHHVWRGSSEHGKVIDGLYTSGGLLCPLTPPLLTT